MQLIQTNSNGDYSDYYVTMVSSSGHYILKFSDTANDIKTNFGGNDWAVKYITHMRNFYNLEKGFLQFVKDKMGINGIELYEIKNNGDVKTIKLKPDGKSIDKKDC